MTKIDKNYIHNTCMDDHEKQLQLKEIKKQQWNELYEYLKVLHNVISIPPRNIKRLQDDLHKQKGYGFDLLLEAYKLSEDKIKWFINDVLKGNCDADGINKCITLMLNNGLNSAYQKGLERQKQQRQTEKLQQQTFNQDMSETIIYTKPKKDEWDISELL